MRGGSLRRTEAEEIDEELFGKYVRAGASRSGSRIAASGELRISNFLLWQVAYSELVFTERRWPEFGPDDLAAVDEYSESQRFGRR